MNNIELIKEFILRKQDLLILIKPISLILLLNETKIELIDITKDYNGFRLSVNNIIPVGEDTYQNNAIDLAKSFYELNIEKAKKDMELLNSIINQLKSKLNFNNDYPIYAEKLAYERRREIEWIFDLILMKNEIFQMKCFEVFNNLIFGELIRINKTNGATSLYSNLISDFEAKSEKWKQSWINEELPNEDLF